MSVSSISLPAAPRLVFDSVVGSADLSGLDEAALLARVGPELGRLELPFERRQKSRFVLQLAGVGPLLVAVPRGRVLRGGERLVASTGAGHLLVASAPESLSWLACCDPLMLSRAAYHLGNRHVPIELRAAGLAYQQDSVLDEMLRCLGLSVVSVVEPFEPEGGAYAGGHGHHG